MRDNEVHVIEVNFFKIIERKKRISGYSHSLKRQIVRFITKKLRYAV